MSSKANQAENQVGFVAPARVTLPYWSTYRDLTSGKNYRQMSPGTRNDWHEIGIDGTGVGGGGGPADGNGIYSGSGPLLAGTTTVTMPADGILQFDSSTALGLFTINGTNNRIGIGIANPGYALHVGGGDLFVQQGSLGVGESPDPTQRVRVTIGDGAYSSAIRVDVSKTGDTGTFSGVQVRSTSLRTGLFSTTYGVNGNLSGGASSGTHTYYGVSGRAIGTPSGSGVVHNVGGVFEALNGTTNFPIQIKDGNEQVGYVLTSDALGRANWAPAAGGGEENLDQTLRIGNSSGNNDISMVSGRKVIFGSGGGEGEGGRFITDDGEAVIIYDSGGGHSFRESGNEFASLSAFASTFGNGTGSFWSFDSNNNRASITNTGGNQLELNWSGISGGTSTRVVNFPDASGTLALQSAATGTFTAGSGETVTVVNGIITSII
jgi:hypothetical protein